MSNYGPKQMKLYDQTKSERRKASRTGEVVEDIGQNTGVRAYSTKPGQLSMKSQADAEARKYRSLNRKQPVKTIKDFTPEELQLILERTKAA